jgi:prepilin-type N-terminal cleavage/methylation domain-containing protein
MNRVLNSNGFSLTELMVVMVVLMLAIIPLATVQTRSQQGVFESEQRSEALYIAQQQMEAVRALGFNNAVTDSGQVRVFSWRTDVQPVSLGLNSVEVTVAWSEKGRARSVVVNDLLSFR